TFVVDELCRGKGIGTKLILEAENEAFQRNCRYISLDTFSFQAPNFMNVWDLNLSEQKRIFPKVLKSIIIEKVLNRLPQPLKNSKRYLLNTSGCSKLET